MYIYTCSHLTCTYKCVYHVYILCVPAVNTDVADDYHYYQNQLMPHQNALYPPVAIIITYTHSTMSTGKRRSGAAVSDMQYLLLPTIFVIVLKLFSGKDI